ncbi:MAG: MoxR family ATPase [Lachnospiraceae bacterium]|nr:MoxR family ATPase [Lachnospiraceae bacterium]
MNPEIDRLISNIERVIIGKKDVIRLTVTALIAGGHVLIEDIPGVGKTQLASALSVSCGGVFNRLQLTPDIMPSDITGFSLIDPKTKELSFRQGAAFCNFLLADEINRSSPKTQSALLEVMEESQISIDGNTYDLPSPFMVLATQNPVETYGTYHLPEAQMDRFLMRLEMGYPGSENELEILSRPENTQAKDIDQVISLKDIDRLKESAKKVSCSELINKYIIGISERTRNDEGILLGVSPRGSLGLQAASKAFALIQGRDYVCPDDVKYLVPFVLSHRMILTAQGRAKWGTASKCLKYLLDEIPVPV